MEKKYDVAIIGWWYGSNYGSVLTYYGLYKTLADFGCEILMVHESLGYNQWRVNWPEDLMSIKFARRIGYKYTDQVHYTKLPELNNQATTFLVGSDQLWNPLIGRVNDDLFLDFVSPANKRVAYATSFGNRATKKFKPSFIEKHKKNLQKFDAVSVREKYAVETAKSIFGVNATQVVDPVFLLEQDGYNELAGNATIKIEGNYLLVFYLDPNENKKQLSMAIADKLGLEKIVVIPNPDKGRPVCTELFSESRFEVISEDSPENFLYAYANSTYVLTDSFHGTAFSVIFRKPFSSIYNNKRGADRFVNLLGDLGFSEARRVYETDNDTKIQENPNVSLSINYTKADVHINKERRKSLKWLKSAVPTNSTEINHRKFFSNKSTWQINPADSMTYLSVGPGAGVKGNLVWCDIATALHKNKSYRISITWVLKTTSKQVGLHLRNAETGKFVVIGSVSPQKKSVGSHTDNIDFIVRENGYTQLMLGALHFIGEGAGAEISKITLKSIVPVSSSEKIANLVEADRDRFLNSYAKGMVSHNIANARALLMFHSHSIEKGLSRNNFRAGFGKVAIPGLAREMKKWIKNDNDKNDSFFKIALSVLNAYFARHREVDFDVSNYWQLFDKEVQEMISNSANDIGGVMPSHVAREEVFSGYDRSFVDVVFGRRSIRVFNHEVVSDELIGKAVRMAMQAPSVCNRQPARVHCYRDSDLMNKALKYQGGWHGYKAPPTLLLVTSELSAYLFPDERNQGYIDGGLFLMNLILAFEAMGLGACSLNTAMSDEYSNKVRKILDVPDSQIFIAFVAVGHYEQGNLVPKSKRIEISEVLNIH